MFLAMAHGTQNHCVCGLCPSSGIVMKYEVWRSGNFVCLHAQVKGWRPSLCWLPYEELNSRHWTSRVHPIAWRRKQMQFSNVVFSSCYNAGRRAKPIKAVILCRFNYLADSPPKCLIVSLCRSLFRINSINWFMRCNYSLRLKIIFGRLMIFLNCLMSLKSKFHTF
jgi:hypothetical protein